MINKIIKSKILPNKNYRITLSDLRSFVFFEDVIIKFRLFVDKEIDDDTIEHASECNSEYSCLDKAIKYVSLVSKSKMQVYIYLKNKKYSNLNIDKAIEKLENLGLIDDYKFGSSYANLLINKGYGKYYIIEKLKFNLIESKIIDLIINNYSETDYLENAIKVLNKQKTNYLKYDNDVQEMKLKKYLESRGFDYSLINKIVK